MGRIVYIGRPTPYVGKTAFYYLANLKNFGVGRMLTQNEFAEFPEPSFHIVKRVRTYINPELKIGKIWCESVIRGKRLPGERLLEIGYRPDFRLVPKDEEEEYLKYPIENLGDNPNILPKYYTIPPLMKEFMKRHFELSNKKPINGIMSESEIQIPFVYQTNKDKRKADADLFWVSNRIANDNEKATANFNGKFQFNEEYSKYL